MMPADGSTFKRASSPTSKRAGTWATNQTDTSDDQSVLKALFEQKAKHESRMTELFNNPHSDTAARNFSDTFLCWVHTARQITSHKSWEGPPNIVLPWEQVSVVLLKLG